MTLIFIQEIFDFTNFVSHYNKNGRDYLNIAPKEQPPRKLSGKWTVQVNYSGKR